MLCVCSSPDVIWLIKFRRMKWEEHVARMEDMRVVYRILVGKPEGRILLERYKRRWNDTIKMDV